MTDDRVFVDANVLVYAYDIDAGAKHHAARTVLVDLWESALGVLSSQVLQEFYVTATRKLATPLPRPIAREVLATYEAWTVHRPQVADLLAASELEERHQLSFWDALIVVSAQRTGARTLLSEDLQHGQHIGQLVITNPFGPPDNDR